MDTNNNDNSEKEIVLVKEEVVANATLNKQNTKSFKFDTRMVALLLFLVGTLCLILGVVLNVVFSSGEMESEINENNNITNNNNNNEEVDDGSFRSFSSYKKFDVTSTVKMISDNSEIDLVKRSKYNMVSNLIYTETEFMGVFSYEYYDYNSKLFYSSADNENWIKRVDEEMVMSLFFSTIVDKVKKNDGVTVLEDGSYTLNLDVSELPDVDGYNGTVSARVVFDIEGYLTDIEFDFSSLTTTGDMVISKVIYKVDNVNQGSGIELPREVIFGAVVSE